MPIPSRADLLEDSVRALARKAAISIGGASVTIEIENRSGLREKEVLDLRSAFEDELRRRGVRILPQSGAANGTLTISENASSYVGILQLRRGEASETWIEAWEHLPRAYGFQPNAGLTLQRELVFVSDQPILDLVFSEDDPKEVQVLKPTQITWYRREGDHWTPDTTLQLPRSTQIGRDLRGRLSFGLDDMSAVFPTETCNLSIHDGDHCQPSAARVDLSDVPSALLEDVEEEESSSWLTAAQMQSEGKSALLVTGKDGRMRLYGDDSELITTFSNFGDQVASIQSDCGSGWQALVTLKEDFSRPDSVQGFEIREQKLIAVTQALQFAGPVLALRRASRNLASRPSGVIAIVLDLQTGLYEAYRLSIACVN
jgi:hypothetical protein